MSYKNYLLPHSWHIAGLIMVAIGIILVAVGLICTPLPESFVLFCAYCISYIGLAIAALSREQVEDEFIVHLRLRTVFWVVFTYMLITIAKQIAEFAIAPYCLSLSSRGAIMRWIMPFFQTPVWILSIL